MRLAAIIVDIAQTLVNVVDYDLIMVLSITVLTANIQLVGCPVVR
jgi:hypothetical protein